MKFAKIFLGISILIAAVSSRRRTRNDVLCSKKVACPKDRVCCAETNDKGKIVSSICQIIVQGQEKCPDKKRPTPIQPNSDLYCGKHKACDNNGKCCHAVRNGWVERSECIGSEEKCFDYEKEIPFKQPKGKGRRRY
jgi:hypothetical protein